MYVITRSGEKEPVKFDKITERIERLSKDFLKEQIDPSLIAKKLSKEFLMVLPQENLIVLQQRLLHTYQLNIPIILFLQGE